MVMNEEDCRLILIKNFIVKKVMVLGNWLKNFWLKPGRNLFWIS